MPYPNDSDLSRHEDANGCGLAGVVRNDQYDDGGYRYGLTVRVNDGYLMAHYFEGFSAGWNRIGYSSNDALISAGNWYHLVVIFNAHNNIQLFVNGKEYLGSYTGTGSGMSYSGSGNGAIGMFKSNNPVRTCYFNGIVDELRFYNRALSESEIQELYNEGNAILIISPPSCAYVTTQGFDLTLIVEAPGLSVVGGSATFDGTDVTTYLAGCLIPGTLVSGGQTFRCPGLIAGALGTGTHTLDITLDLSDGSSVSDTVTWEVKENTEP